MRSDEGIPGAQASSWQASVTFDAENAQIIPVVRILIVMATANPLLRAGQRMRGDLGWLAVQVDAPEPVHAIARVPAGWTAGWLLDYDRDFPGLATSRLPRLLTAQASPAVKHRTLADRSHPSPRRSAHRHGQHPAPRSPPCGPDEQVRYATPRANQWVRRRDRQGPAPDVRASTGIKK